MKEKRDRDTNSRRNFLKKGLTLGAGAVAGGSVLKAIQDNEVKKSAGKKIKVLTQDGRLIEVDESLAEETLYNLTDKELRIGIKDRKFVMVIDLAKCANARKCVDECQHHHSLRKDEEFMKVYLMQDDETTAPYWFPKPCYHCDQPPCVKVCPVNATYKRRDGVVLIDNERCIGCKFCITGCPYSARIFNWDEPEINEEAKNKPYSPETSVPPREGTVSKCDFCPDLAREGKLPYCASACPMGVIYFGDANEDTVTNGTETVRLSKLLSDRSGYRYLENLGTEPRVYYLPPTDRMFTVERGYESLTDELKARYKNTPFFKKKNKIK